MKKAAVSDQELHHEGSPRVTKVEEKLPDLYVVMAIVEAARAFEKREADAAARGMALKMRKGLTTKGHQGARRKGREAHE